MLTALANDLSYADVFREQLVYYMGPKDAYMGPKDAVWLVSASRHSPNVVTACRHAKEQGVPTIAFVGFDGGELGRLADHTIWIPVKNYGIVEDAHQSLMHVLTQFLRTRAEVRAGGAEV